jgi:hypothetical protein
MLAIKSLREEGKSPGERVYRQGKRKKPLEKGLYKI